MFQRILVPTDGSAASEAAAHAAIAFARGYGSQLVALSLASPGPGTLSMDGVLPDMDIDVRLEQAEDAVHRIADAAAGEGVDCATLTGYAYSPACEIIDVARRNRCDLIFMATHGRRSLSRLFAGSVAHRVLAESPVPVMVYRAPPPPASWRRADGQDARSAVSG